MNNISNAIHTQDILMLQMVAQYGSLAQAARQMGLVPSSLTYRVRQLEEALDVLLIDRVQRKAQLTPAGQELAQQGQRLVDEMHALATRVKRIAIGWEPTLTIAVDSILSRNAVFDLVEQFYQLGAPTRLRLRSEVMQGGWEALASGAADLALGIGVPDAAGQDFAAQVMGQLRLIFVVAPHHPLAQAPEPLSDDTIAQHRAIAVADSAWRGLGMTVGLLDGQNTLTVPTMNSKIEAQLRGLGCGFVPACQVQGYLEAGRLVAKKVERPDRISTFYSSWRKPKRASIGKGLAWWIEALAQPRTQEALLSQRGGGL